MRKTLLLFAFLSFVASSASAKNDDFNDFHASRFAQLLDRVKEPEDLYKKLPLNEKTRELIKKDIEGKPKGDFDKAPVWMEGSQTVIFKAPERDVRFSFAKFDEGILLVDGKKIEITDAKTYLNFKNEIAAALEIKSSMFSIFVEEARAQDRVGLGRSVGNWISAKSAAALYAMRPDKFTFQNLDSSTEANLEANIARAYEQDLRAYQGPDGFDPNTMIVEGPGYLPPTFNCSQGKLTLLARSRSNGRGGLVADSQVLQSTPKGWSYKEDAETPVLSLDKNFVVNGSAEGLAAKGSNFLNHVQNPWRHFPAIAQRCCAKAGCHAAVTRAAQPNFRQRRTEDATRGAGSK
jgi:hypothetical protein